MHICDLVGLYIALYMSPQKKKGMILDFPVNLEIYLFMSCSTQATSSLPE